MGHQDDFVRQVADGAVVIAVVIDPVRRGGHDGHRQTQVLRLELLGERLQKCREICLVGAAGQPLKVDGHAGVR